MERKECGRLSKTTILEYICISFLAILCLMVFFVMNPSIGDEYSLKVKKFHPQDEYQKSMILKITDIDHDGKEVKMSNGQIMTFDDLEKKYTLKTKEYFGISWTTLQMFSFVSILGGIVLYLLVTQNSLFKKE